MIQVMKAKRKIINVKADDDIKIHIKSAPVLISELKVIIETEMLTGKLYEPTGKTSVTGTVVFGDEFEMKGSQVFDVMVHFQGSPVLEVIDCELLTADIGSPILCKIGESYNFVARGCCSPNNKKKPLQ